MKRRIRRRVDNDQPSAIKTYNPPWMWSWWVTCPSELQEYPIEALPINPSMSFAGKKDRGSEPEMLSTKLKGKQWKQRDRKVKGTFL